MAPLVNVYTTEETADEILFSTGNDTADKHVYHDIILFHVVLGFWIGKMRTCTYICMFKIQYIGRSWIALNCAVMIKLCQLFIAPEAIPGVPYTTPKPPLHSQPLYTRGSHAGYQVSSNLLFLHTLI